MSSALAHLLTSESGFSVTEVRVSGVDGLERACREAAATVVILDIASTSTDTREVIEALREVQTVHGLVAVVGSESPGMVVQMFRAGARGVVTRDAAPAELVAAAREVAAGHVFASRTAMILAFEQLRFAPSTSEVRAGADLSDREREVVTLLTKGMTNNEIARVLHVSEGTAKAHLSRVMMRWGVRDRVQLVVRALAGTDGGCDGCRSV